jgi:acetyl esterase/lipase
MVPEHPREKRSKQLIYRTITLIAVAIAATACAQAASTNEKEKGKVIDVKLIRDIEYRRVDGKPILLDVYQPQGADKPLPVLLWIHGGGWESGDKNSAPDGFDGNRGYAAVSIDYRLSNVATFPAQIEDCRAAVRWIRAHAKEYNLDPNRIAVWGVSAGGHLAALLGTSADIKRLDGDCKDNLQYSSAVQVVIDWCGPTDLLHMGNCIPDTLERFLGGPPAKVRAKAEMASPITFVSKNDPPFQIMHGEADDIVPCQQAQTLHDALRRVGVECELHIFKGIGHGYYDAGRVEEVYAFMDKHLKR